MGKRPPIVNWLSGTDITLGYFSTKAYTDDELLAVADNPVVDKAWIKKQPLTRVPPFPPMIADLAIRDCRAFTTLAGIERLVGLTEVTLAELPALDLARELPRLAELPELATLALDVSTLRALPAALAKLPSLISLTLFDTDELDLAASLKVLGKIRSLRSLVLVRETAGVLADAFAAVPQLTALALRRAANLPRSIGKLANLEELDLDGCGALDLAPVAGKLTRLRALSLAKSKITALPDELCACTALTTIDAAESALATLPAAIGRLAALTTLDLSRTKLRAVPASLGDLAALRSLALPAARVPAGVLEKLSLTAFAAPRSLAARVALRDAELLDDEDVSIDDEDRIPASFGNPEKVFVGLEDSTVALPQLRGLTALRACELRYGGDLAPILRDLATAPLLRTLTLCGPHAKLPDELGLLTSLTDLQLGQARMEEPDPLREIPRAIGRLANLRSLGIAAAITSLPVEIGALVRLETLAIEGPLATVPAALGALPRLASLSLAGLAGGAPCATIARCPALAKIEIWKPAVSAQHLADLGRAPALRELELHGNLAGLAALLAAFAGAPLEQLTLDGTAAWKLPSAIGGLTALRFLGLDDWCLEAVPAELAALVNLRRIVLPSRLVTPDTKAKLPPGRWRKGHVGRSDYYERTDLLEAR